MNKNIVLIGMMGSGKSTLGRSLAKRLNKTFVDSDREIEKAAFMSISEIIERDGEDFFRDREEKVIERLLGSTQQVIALGGGSILSEIVRKKMKENCITIWIKVHQDILCKRLRNSRKERPLIQQKDVPLESIIEKLLKEREVYYSQANITLEADHEKDHRIEDILFHLENAIADYTEQHPCSNESQTALDER